MTMPIDLVLVRHGESEGNVANRASRRGDHSYFTEGFKARHSSTWRLTERGREQARIAGEWIRANIGDRFDRYYTSEYLRAMETSALLGFPEAKWYAELYLRERNWGTLDVMDMAQRFREHHEALRRRKVDGMYWTPTNGESIADLCLRAPDRMFQTLHRECADKRVIMVNHGEVMWAHRIRLERMLQAEFIALSESKDPFDKIHNCQVLHYTRRDPESGALSSHVQWMRSVCPTDLTRSRNEWQRITRRSFSNEELLAYVDEIQPNGEG